MTPLLLKVPFLTVKECYPNQTLRLLRTFYLKGTFDEALNEVKEIVKQGINIDDVTTIKVHQRMSEWRSVDGKCGLCRVRNSDKWDDFSLPRTSTPRA